MTKTDKPLPVCSDCHTAHQIRRTDDDGFKLEIMQTLRPLPRQKLPNRTSIRITARSRAWATPRPPSAYDCHGAHDILPVDRSAGPT